MISDKQQTFPNQQNQLMEQFSQTGKSFEEVLPYLLSGESDDLTSEFTNKL